ncbi:zinc finger protein 853-like isoform X6 [Lineus longissimus]|uniref:zinc finger protein 853-like isoform X6 n=1 Tax=Lineus longissimus TaxID=88925 RepID=UPI00315D3689
MKDGNMSMLESQKEESRPSENMQMELHSKGAVLTKAWSDLFSFITKYQAELAVKENTVEIAEREIDVRKRQLEEMKPMVEAGNEEVEKLQEEIRTKERLLSKSQSELSVKEQLLRSVQSDLTCNMELLEKARCNLLDSQSELVHNRGDLERLKSELTIKQDQIQIKDNLLRKLQNQLMKENAELKEQLEIERKTLELERRNFEMERRSHELTKRNLRGKSNPSSTASVIEIPDSPPKLDLSVEQADFSLSNIISSAETQSKMEQDVYKLSHSTAQDSRRSPMTTTPTKPPPAWSLPSPSATSPSRYSLPTPNVQTTFQDAFPLTDNFNVSAASVSDTFFPLSVEGGDSKAGIDTSASMYLDTEMQGSGQYMPGTPGSSGTSDSNQGGPVPVSGPIPTSGMPGSGLQEGTDGKLMHHANSVCSRKSAAKSKAATAVCDVCGKEFMNVKTLRVHKGSVHGDRPLYTCDVCQKTYYNRSHFRDHVNSHNEVKNYTCPSCGKVLGHQSSLSRHMKDGKCVRGDEKKNKKDAAFVCQTCGDRFRGKSALLEHDKGVHKNRLFKCLNCGKTYRWRSCFVRHKKRCQYGFEINLL